MSLGAGHYCRLGTLGTRLVFTYTRAGEVAVVRVCAWCCRFTGLKRPLQRWTVTHGICASCHERFPLGPSGVPTATGMLIISQDSLGIEAASELIGRAAYPMVLIADRRRADRRRKRVQVTVERRQGDRRAVPPASWAQGYVVVDAAPDLELAALTLG
jgi:hypothetical protein